MMKNEERSKNDDSVSKEQECEYLRQRYSGMKAVLDKYQQDLTSYKTKVQGVDSVIQLLKEARQESANLHKRNKALEVAVSNLQRRLSKNGLSSSLSLQDTELFLPGASKQTLDNLAKENVRLRNLLKNGHGQSDKKSTEELDDLKATNEKLESENNVLKRDIESYEQRVATLLKVKEEKKSQLEQEPTKDETNKTVEETKKECVEMISVECQAYDPKSGAILELSELLKLTVKHCTQLDEQIQQSSEKGQSSQDEKFAESNLNNLKTPVLVDEDYQKIKSKLDEALLMNQRWQVYSQNQAQRIEVLTGNIADLKKSQEMNLHAASTVHQEEVDKLKSALNSKDVENQELRKQAMGLSKEVQHYRKEMSNVEILKQQIQVCTEDFNTERKDREQAVSKVKALQDENMKHKAEIDRLKILNNTELMSRYQHPSQQIGLQNAKVAAQRRYEIGHERSPPHQTLQNVGMEYPFSQPRLSVPQQVMSEATSLSPRTPFADYSSRQVMADSSQLPAARNFQSHSLPRQLFNDPGQTHSMSTNIPAMEQMGGKDNLSMPALSKQGVKTQQVLSCPKCNKEFPLKDGNSADLLTHIDMCNA